MGNIHTATRRFIALTCILLVPLLVVLLSYVDLEKLVDRFDTFWTLFACGALYTCALMYFSPRVSEKANNRLKKVMTFGLYTSIVVFILNKIYAYFPDEEYIVGLVAVFFGVNYLLLHRKSIEHVVHTGEPRQHICSFAEKYPRIAKIPIIRTIARWLHKEGYPYNILLILGLCVLCGAFIYNLTTIEFIYTDEGRLFYDAELILEGKVPFKDFNARAPLIIYSLALFTFIFGNTIYGMYILSIILMLIAAFFIYILTRRLYTKTIGIIAMLAFGSAPIMINLLHMKTQTFQLPILLGALVLFDSYLKSNKRKYLIWSAIVMLCSLLCRESTIVFFSTLLLIVLWRTRWEWTKIKRALKVYTLYVVSVMGVFLILNRLFFTYNGGSNVSNALKISFEIDESSIARSYLIPTYFSDAYLLLFAFSLILLLYCIINIRSLKNQAIAAILPTSTVLALGVFYFYNTLRHGWWPQYLMEFAPFYSIAVALITGLLVAPVVKKGYELVRNDTKYYHVRVVQKRILPLILGVILIALIGISHGQSYVAIKEYKGVFHLDGSLQVAQHIALNTDPDDVIFGGNPVYAYLSDRPHFMSLSHLYYSDRKYKEVFAAMKENPPQYIIRDHYSEKFYFSHGAFRHFVGNYYVEEEKFEERAYGKLWRARLYVRK